jgi:hypothetical protein
MLSIASVAEATQLVQKVSEEHVAQWTGQFLQRCVSGSPYSDPGQF